MVRGGGGRRGCGVPARGFADAEEAACEVALEAALEAAPGAARSGFEDTANLHASARVAAASGRRRTCSTTDVPHESTSRAAESTARSRTRRARTKKSG